MASAAGRSRIWATAGQRATSRATTSRTAAPSWRGSAAPVTCPSFRPSRPPSSRRAPSYNVEISRSHCSRREWGRSGRRGLLGTTEAFFLCPKSFFVKKSAGHAVFFSATFTPGSIRGCCCETRGVFYLLFGQAEIAAGFNLNFKKYNKYLWWNLYCHCHFQCTTAVKFQRGISPSRSEPQTRSVVVVIVVVVVATQSSTQA